MRIFGLCGPCHRFQIALLHSLTMPPFSDLSSSQLLMLMLARYSSSHQILCAFNLVFSSVAMHAFPPATTGKNRVFLFGNVLLKFLFYLKTLDNVALCLLYSLVYGLCPMIQPETSLPRQLFLLVFVRGTYIPFFTRLLLTSVSIIFFVILYLYSLSLPRRREHQENH